MVRLGAGERSMVLPTTISLLECSRKPQRMIYSVFFWLLSLTTKLKTKTKKLWPSLKLIWGSPRFRQLPPGGYIFFLFSFSRCPPLTSRHWTPFWLSLWLSSMLEPSPALRECRGHSPSLNPWHPSSPGTPAALPPLPGLPRSLVKIASPASHESQKELDDT